MSTNVKVYSTTWCGFCKMAKNYLKQLGVEYNDIDIEKDPVAGNEVVQKSGQTGVPVLDIGGSIIVGFDKPAIDKALADNKLI